MIKLCMAFLTLSGVIAATAAQAQTEMNNSGTSLTAAPMIASATRAASARVGALTLQGPLAADARQLDGGFESAAAIGRAAYADIIAVPSGSQPMITSKDIDVMRQAFTWSAAILAGTLGLLRFRTPPRHTAGPSVITD